MEPGTIKHREAKIIGLVSCGHFFSHFYGLAIPPLIPVLRLEFDASYAQLGLLVSAMSLASGVAQIPVGFLVDRLGPAKILAIGLAIQAAAILLVGLAPSYAAVLVLVTVAGLGNSVFHPANYSILSAAIPHHRLGRAFSIHSFAGHVGFAAAPLVIGAFAVFLGWRTGLVIVGGLGLAAAGLIMVNAATLAMPTDSAPGSAPRSGQSLAQGLKLLGRLPILMAFAFFFLISLAWAGLDTFLVAAMMALHDAAYTTANLALAALFVGSAIGILFGGVIADRTTRHGTVAAAGLTVAALLIALVGSLALPVGGLIALIMLAGLASGVVPPSRDLLVRAATPEGATGKVFGFVSVGLDIGGVVAPLVFGWFMDGGGMRWIFWGSAAIMLAAIATVVATQQSIGNAKRL